MHLLFYSQGARQVARGTDAQVPHAGSDYAPTLTSSVLLLPSLCSW